MTDQARRDIVSRIERIGAVAVVRLQDHDKLRRVAEAIAEGGVSAVEVTMTVPDAIGMIRRLSDEVGDALLIGVGSVLDPDTAKAAVDAGARYVVSPVFKPEVIAAAHKAGVPAMPGCFTPTEIQTATEAGADIVKVFPADVVGMPFFKAVKAPMPHLKLMPTGGVSLTNGGDWIRAGACAVGVGSALLDKETIDAGDWAALTDNAKTLKASVDAAR